MNSRAGSSFTFTAYRPPADREPDLAGLAARYPERYPFLLESVAAGPALARYNILFGFPGDTLELSANGDLTGAPGIATRSSGFLHALDEWWQTERSDDRSDELPFTGGWFVFLGYELAAEVEPTLRLQFDAAMPVAFATRVPLAVIHDTRTDTFGIVAEDTATMRVQQVVSDLDTLSFETLSANTRSANTMATDALPEFTVVEDDPAIYLAAVERAKQYIAAGDIFQANLSRRWRVQMHTAPAPVELYRRLRRTNPSPFGGLIQRPDFALVSSSPERLIRRRGQRLDTRPIAGTRPRTEVPEQTEMRKQELLGHPKERAEHIMVIDLERNDLGRVCEGGSVNVDEYMVIESYSHVHHIVSNVTGRARPDVTPGELIRAVFPGGTITGCPKVRCMEIISELEDRPRGAYTGSMGYLNRNGDCDLNILIRTMSVRGRELEIAAGSGIVADSEPADELDETRAKAKGLLLALQPLVGSES